jgi:MFS transporter, ACDE family, multidrug resistance protein
MKAAPVERGVVSAAYSFVRFSGGAVAPWLAGKLGEEINVHVPFWVGSFAVALAVGALALTRPYLRHIDDPEPEENRESEAEREAQAVTVGDA